MAPAAPLKVLPGLFSMDAPSEADVLRISAMTDLAMRNLHITQAYHAFSQALAQRYPEGANWCTFATWASRQAGLTIRQEDLRHTFEEHFDRSDAARQAVALLARTLGQQADVQRLRAAVQRVLDPQAALARAAGAVARGNVKVFEEVGLAFARYLAFFGPGEPVTAERTARFCDTLRPGDPPEGQGLLRDGFAAYRAAEAASDAGLRAQWLFFANLCVGLHEQTRLQPEIRQALDAAADVDALRRRLLAALVPARLLRVRLTVARLLGRPLPLDTALDALIEAFRQSLRGALTHHLMSLRLPEGRVLALGRDLQHPYPPALAHPALPALRALLARIDPTPEGLAQSGARDWADLPDRMHFIAELFRTHQTWPPLFTPPFTGAQVEALRQGRLPEGPL